MIVGYSRTQRFKALNMLVNRTGFKIASAGKTNRRFLKSSKERSHHIIRSPEFLHRSIRHWDGYDSGGINPHLAACPGDRGSKLFQNFRVNSYITKGRQVIQNNFRLGQNRRRNKRNRTILRSTDGDNAF
ncbi:hypothetical protein D3C75_836680 [compost metagenome]